jgi:hypothetical protein
VERSAVWPALAIFRPGFGQSTGGRGAPPPAPTDAPAAAAGEPGRAGPGGRPRGARLGLSLRFFERVLQFAPDLVEQSHRRVPPFRGLPAARAVGVGGAMRPIPLRMSVSAWMFFMLM